MADTDNPVVGQSQVEPRVLEGVLENFTRHDFFSAAPASDVSDHTLHIMWSIYSAVFYVLAAFNFVVFLAMVTNRAVRQNSFSLYLMFIVLPEVASTSACAAACTFLATTNEAYVQAGLCRFQSFNIVFGIGTSVWLNAVMAHEIHTMLRLSKRGFRYRVPSQRSVVRNSMLCYVWMLFVASWGLFGFSWHSPAPHKGIFCYPEQNLNSNSLFFWLAFTTSLLLIPLSFVGWVTFDIFYRDLMPPCGRRRQLAMFFFRIMIVFIVFWLPVVLLISGVGGSNVPPWVLWAFGAWGHLQGAISTILKIASKPDVRDAVYQFVRCKGDETPVSSADEESSLPSLNIDSSKLDDGWRMQEEIDLEEMTVQVEITDSDQFQISTCPLPSATIDLAVVGASSDKVNAI